MRYMLVAGLLGISLVAPGCHLTCCPDTADKAGLPVRIQHPASKPAEASGTSALPLPAAPETR